VNNLKKFEPALIVSAALGLLLSFIIIVILSHGSTKNNVISVLQPTPTGAPQIDATFSLSEPTTMNVGGTAPLGLELTPKVTKNISAFSVRLFYPYDPETASYTALAFNPNPDLVQNGWSFPINKVSVDSDRKMMTIDISGINTNLTGYELGSAVELGTVDFQINKQISSLTVDMDKSQTKILGKDASELNYVFVNQ
jgi:hypothetical protein